MEFMSEYKHLEKLCSEVMKADHAGVTAYIEEMAAKADGERLVPGWGDDLRALKRYRHIRNQIAHEPDCTEEDMCDPEDAEWLAAFYDRIMDEDDPLARYRQRVNAIRSANAAASRHAHRAASSVSSTPASSSTSATSRSASGSFAYGPYTPDYPTNPYLTNPLLQNKYQQPPKKPQQQKNHSFRYVLLVLLALLLLFGFAAVRDYLPQILQNLSSALSGLHAH